MPIPAGSRYVAMGSSFAAGPGLPSRVPGSPRRAGRSTGNYAHLIARELGLDLHDVIFSGATTSDLLSPSASGTAAQLDAVTPETPACRVVVVDYLTVLPPDGPAPDPPPPAEITTWGRTLAARLAATTQAAASTAGWRYIAASAASADHHAWSAKPWTRRFHLSLRGGALYHPNAAGMVAVAGLVITALRVPEVHQ
jgi:hypothetical protein